MKSLVALLLVSLAVLVLLRPGPDRTGSAHLPPQPQRQEARMPPEPIQAAPEGSVRVQALDGPRATTAPSGTERVGAAGRATLFRGRVLSRLLAAAGPREALIRLRRAGRLSGRVSGRDPDVRYRVEAVTGVHSLVEASLDADIDFIGGEAAFQAPVEASGAYVLADLPSAVPLRVALRGSEGSLRTRPQPVTLEPGESRRLDWRLGSGGTVRGRVVGSLGQRVADQEVWLLSTHVLGAHYPEWYDEPTRRTRTDERGGFVFEDLQAGRWHVGIAPIPLSGRALPAAPAAYALPVEVRMEETAPPVELVLHRGLYIEGVVEGTHGEPVSASVSAASARGSRSDVAGEDGTFRIGPLVAGPHEVRASSFGVPGMADSLKLRAWAGGRDIVLRLRRGGDIAGRVVDSVTGEEVPAEILVTQPDGSFIYSTEVPAFEYEGLQPGVHHLTATTRDGRVGSLTDVRVAAGDSLEELLIEVAPAAFLTVSYHGSENQVGFEVLRDGALFVESAVQRGGRRRVAVPAGRLDVRFGCVEEGGELREITVEIGQELALRFEGEESR